MCFLIKKINFFTTSFQESTSCNLDLATFYQSKKVSLITSRGIGCKSIIIFFSYDQAIFFNFSWLIKKKSDENFVCPWFLCKL
jgi:hypothetical protein